MDTRDASAAPPLVARLEAASPPAQSGALLLEEGFAAKWDAAALVLARPGSVALRVDDADDGVSLQLSRWREAGAASLWASLRGVRAPSRELLCAELRDRAGTRLTLLAPCDTAETRALLEGLPWLAPREAIVLEAAQLVSLLEVACAHGAQLARWDADATEAPEQTLPRAVSRGLAQRIVLSSLGVPMGLLLMFVGLMMFAVATGIAVRLFGAVFFLVGGVAVHGGVREGLQTLALLRQGHVALARLAQRRIEVEGHGKSRRKAHHFSFEFQSADGLTHTTTCKVYEPARLEDEASERVLYDPAAPVRAMPVDLLPGTLSLDEHGRITGAAPWLRPILAVLLGVLLGLSMLFALLAALV